MPSQRATRLQNLYPYMDAELGPQCTNAMRLHELKLSARSFFDDTGVWQEELAAIDTVADQDEYTLRPRWDAFIQRVVSVTLSDSTLVSDDWEFDGDSTLTLDNAPQTAETDALDVVVVLVPNLDATSFPIWLLERYSTAIIAGAMANLLSMPNKAWTNLQRAGIHDMTRRVAEQNAKIETARAFKFGAVRVNRRNWV